MMKIYILIVSFMLLSFVACNNASDKKLKDGRWKGEFLVADQKIPFVFEVQNSLTDSATVILMNGAERVSLKGIVYSADSIIIPIDAYDSQLIGKITNDVFEGKFRKLYIDNDAVIPFTATKSESPRFVVATTPTTVDVTGKWDVKFIDQKGDTSNNVGIFNLDKNLLTGSILTNTGDLRYLEGSMTEDGFQLSAFAGQNPYLIKAIFSGNDEFNGEFYTTRGVTKLLGKRNSNAALSDAYSLSYMKKGQNKINFSLPDLDGKAVSLSDSQYQGKVVILSILGSWCPNCLDEMEYLSPWYKENNKRGVEIIGLAFERKDDPEYVKMVLSRLINRYDVDYKILFAGKLGNESMAKALPTMDKVAGYPTTIFIDKKGIVRKIHTGFNGPATGLFYDEFKKEFNHVIDELLNER